MAVTKPITDKGQLEDIMEVYEKDSKNYLILAYALNTGLRVSDILRATVGESKKGYWIGKEQKTGKAKEIKLPINLRMLVIDYADKHDLKADDPLFHNNRDKTKAISRQAVDKVIRNAGDMVGMERLSAHSLRKTFGYMMYKSKHYDLAELQYIFNHSSSEVTLRYIGVTQKSINDKMENISIGI